MLSNEQIVDLMKQLTIVHDTFGRIDANAYKRMDIEIKADGRGRVQIKQARPL